MKKISVLFLLVLTVFALSGCDLLESPVIKITIDYNMEGVNSKVIEVDINNPSFDEPDPEQDGYVFDGWYTDASYEDGFTVQDIVSSDLIIYAKWVPAEYWLSFVVGNNNIVFEQRVAYGTDLTGFTLPDAPIVDGYEFVGWDLLPETMPLNNLEIVGTYEIAVYDVNFYVNNELVLSSQYNLGDEIVYPENPLVDGFTFIEWRNKLNNTLFDKTVVGSEGYDVFAYLDPDKFTLTLNNRDGELIEEIIVPYTHELSSVTIPTAPEIVGYEFVSWSPNIPETMPMNDLTLQAVYDALVYEIEYILNGYKYKSDSYLYDEEIIYPTVLESDQMEFSGWFIDADMQIPFNATNMVAEDITLYGEAIDNTVIDDLPTEQIEITFWHVYGQSKSALLEDMITEFETMYPNINVTASSQGNYDDLFNKTVLAISANAEPNIVVGYNNHFEVYDKANVLENLDKFAYHSEHGIDWDSYVDSFVDESHNTLPYSKSSEVLIYNKTYFDAAGIIIPDDRPLTYAELFEYTSTMVGTGENQCDFLLNFDSSLNFINNFYMMNTPILTGTLEDNLESMASIAESQEINFANKTFVYPEEWYESYGSSNFIAGDVCMTISSTAGVAYNIPFDDSFEVGITYLPQIDLDNQVFTQSGPDIGILDSSYEEELASWLLIKFLTNAENSLDWALLTGYLPVHDESYTCQEFLDFIALNDDSRYYDALTQKVGLYQKDYMRTSNIPLDVLMGSDSTLTDLYYGEATKQEYLDKLMSVASPWLTDSELKNEFSLILDLENIIFENISLPSNYDGNIITWSSSNPEVLSNEGIVTRPVYGEGDQTILLQAMITIGEETFVNEYMVVVPEAEYIKTYTVVTDVYDELLYGDRFIFEGVVSFIYDGGYFLTDGTNSIGVYNRGIEVQLGDKLSITGTYSSYYTLYQMNQIESEVLISSGNQFEQELIQPSITRLLEYDSSNKTLSGTKYHIQGVLEQREPYGHLYLIDQEGSEVLIYYYSLADSLTALENYIGNEISIEVIYYTDHHMNGPMVAFMGGVSDITLVSTQDEVMVNDTQIVINDLKTVTRTDVTLPSVGVYGTTFTNWQSTNPEIMDHTGKIISLPTETTIITLSVDTAYGTYTGSTSVEVTIPAMSTNLEVLNTEIGNGVYVSGVVNVITYYGVFIYDGSDYLFIYGSNLKDEVHLGDMIEVVGRTMSYKDLVQVSPLSYVKVSEGNMLHDDVVTATVAGIDNQLYQMGERLTITGKVSFEGSYHDVVITDPSGLSVTVYYRSNADEIADYGIDETYLGKIITIEVIYYQDGRVLYQGVRSDIIEEVSYTDLYQAQSLLDSADLGQYRFVSEDIPLITEHVDYGNVFTWTSSNTNILANDGTIYPDTINQTVTMSLSVTIGTETVTKDYEITVIGVE